MKTFFDAGYTNEDLYSLTGAKFRDREDKIFIAEITNNLCYDARWFLCQQVKIEHHYKDSQSWSNWSTDYYKIWLPVPRE